MSIVDSYPGRCEVFADSGAFSAYTVGATISLDDYGSWLRDWSGLLTTSSTLDVIGDPDATDRNTAVLEDRGFRVLPVFHVGSPWGRLERLCQRYPYVALGGMVPYKSRVPEVMRWLIRCFQIAESHGTVFHGFGMTRVKLLKALPFYSVDSSTWTAGARYGKPELWDRQRSAMVEVRTGSPTVARQYARVISEHGLSVKLFGSPGFARFSQRSREQFHLEDEMLRGAPALAYTRLGEWLTHRHHVPAPPGLSSIGTVLFLAEVTAENLIRGGRGIAAGTVARKGKA